MRDILSFSFEEYIARVKAFHGNTAPGAVLGGFMVEHAYNNLPEGGLYNVICETAKCLPDAVQLLTPCSVGNQWMKIIDVGRFALTFYDKATGKGVRVYLDHRRLDKWPRIKGWYLKLKTKNAQNKELLLHEIEDAGSQILGIRQVNISPDFLSRKKSSPISICPVCDEAYPFEHESACPACKDSILPYGPEISGCEEAQCSPGR
ncbi:MAG TPA: formylmethanofuran dehydrogenase subunit E family protein [Syntrophorhabdaceae bacterium]|nr:formylmethanofuran dehydrogenase subunit E family protein [Syntrophorhabdaceae bacterium]